MDKGKCWSANGLTRERGSHHRGKSARPFLRQRGTVEHWRLVNDVVEPRTWDAILKGREWGVIRVHSFPLCFSASFISINAWPHCHPPGQASLPFGGKLAPPFPSLPAHCLSYQVLEVGIPAWVWDPQPGSGSLHHAFLRSRRMLFFFVFFFFSCH